MENNRMLFQFCIDESKYAIHLELVERVVPAMEITPVPEADLSMLGVINLHGKIVNVLDLRQKLGLSSKEMELTDKIVVTNTGKFLVAFPVDQVIGVMECPPSEITEAKDLCGAGPDVEGILKTNGEIIFIFDLDTFLTTSASKVIELNHKKTNNKGTLVNE